MFGLDTGERFERSELSHSFVPFRTEHPRVPANHLA
jgi:hypothetical protein